jgi:hypothetical protein
MLAQNTIAAVSVLIIILLELLVLIEKDTAAAWETVRVWREER